MILKCSFIGAPVIQVIAIYFMITEAAEVDTVLFSHADLWKTIQSKLLPIHICDLEIAEPILLLTVHK